MIAQEFTDANDRLLLVKSSISSCSIADLDSVLASGPIPSNVVNFLEKEAVPSLLKSSAKPSRAILHTILSVLSNQSLLVDVVSRTASSANVSDRLFAISLLPLVTNTTPLRNAVFLLTIDRTPAIRIAAIRALPETRFDPAMSERLLRLGLADQLDQVRATASEILPLAAPHLVREYAEFLGRVPEALRNFPRMVEVNGLSAFAAAIKDDESAEALLRAMPFVPRSEHAIAIDCLERCAGCRSVVMNVLKFASFVDDPVRLIALVHVGSLRKWRDRAELLRRCIEWATTFGAALVGIAAEFANDPAAIVRSQSVVLWTALVRKEWAVAGCLNRLLIENWQTRLVLAKIVAAVGPDDRLTALEWRLRLDPVEIVRNCVAKGHIESVRGGTVPEVSERATVFNCAQ
jgi:hypothetical protein